MVTLMWSIFEHALYVRTQAANWFIAVYDCISTTAETPNMTCKCRWIHTLSSVSPIYHHCYHHSLIVGYHYYWSLSQTDHHHHWVSVQAHLQSDKSLIWLWSHNSETLCELMTSYTSYIVLEAWKYLSNNSAYGVYGLWHAVDLREQL